MPVELGVWRIDHDLKKVEIGSLDHEERLEGFLDKDISIASPNWMVIGRQVHTGYGGYIDLLAIDRDGNLIVIELKKDMTPREVVAQLLDYASWVKDLKEDDIARIYSTYLEKYHKDRTDESIDDVFRARFNVREMPDSLNDQHQLVVVASSLDPSTERIVSYLSEAHGVSINAIFFRVFKDEDREYLSSVWFIDPTTQAVGGAEPESKEDWNGEFYVSFGHGERRHWEEAIKYGFISAGGGSWYSKTLYQLESGDRIWVNVPGTGYVGVGKVKQGAVRVDGFVVKQDDGTDTPIKNLAVDAPQMFKDMSDDSAAEHLVRVAWIKTVDLNHAIKEKGFFGNQNSVCRPTAKSWNHTVERLKKRFGVS